MAAEELGVGGDWWREYQIAGEDVQDYVDTLPVNEQALLISGLAGFAKERRNREADGQLRDVATRYAIALEYFVDPVSDIDRRQDAIEALRSKSEAILELCAEWGDVIGPGHVVRDAAAVGYAFIGVQLDTYDNDIDLLLRAGVTEERLVEIFRAGVVAALVSEYDTEQSDTEQSDAEQQVAVCSRLDDFNYTLDDPYDRYILNPHNITLREELQRQGQVLPELQPDGRYDDSVVIS